MYCLSSIWGTHGLDVDNERGERALGLETVYRFSRRRVGGRCSRNFCPRSVCWNFNGDPLKAPSPSRRPCRPWVGMMALRALLRNERFGVGKR